MTGAALWPEAPPAPRLPTGLASLDVALGGGWPVGRVVELSGPPGIGKTSIALAGCAALQRAGEADAYIDVAGTIDPLWRATCGVDPGLLLLAEPRSIEAAIDAVERMVRMHTPPRLIVLDDMGAMHQRAGGLAPEACPLPGSMSRFLRRFLSPLSRADVCLLILTPVIATTRSFGIVDQSPGGNAIKYYATVRARLTPGEADDGLIRVRATVIKNKLSAPFTTADLTRAPGRPFQSET